MFPMIALLVLGQMTGTHTVGAGAEFATPTAAVAALNAQGVGPGGVTFLILAGTYEMTASLELTVTGAVDRPIEFRAAGNGEAIQVLNWGAPLAERPPVWHFHQDLSYFTLRGLTIQGNGRCIGRKSRGPNARLHFIRIIGCRLTTTGDAAIMMNSREVLAVSDVSDITITDNTVTSRIEGIGSHGPRVLIARNTVRAFGCIFLGADTGLNWGGAVVEDNRLYAEEEGIHIRSVDCDVRRNRIQLVSAVRGTGVSDWGEDNKIHHNTISFDPACIEEAEPEEGVSGGHVGILLGFSVRTQCVFNSIYMRVVGKAGRDKASAGILVGSAWMDYDGSLVPLIADVEIANNVIHGSATHPAGASGSATVFLILSKSVSQFEFFGTNNEGLLGYLDFTSVTNCLYRHEEADGDVVTFGAIRQQVGDLVQQLDPVEQVEYPTLTDWQTYSGQDLESVAVDPRYVSTTDLHLQVDSPVQGIGTALTGYTHDIDGDRRKTTPDIGCDEPRPARLAGDINGDGRVDSADYVMWRKNYGRRAVTLTFNDGDFNGDGRVDSGDYVGWRKLGSSQELYQVWRANYGRVSTPPLTESDGDLNLDGVVDTADYYIWRANYGRHL